MRKGYLLIVMLLFFNSSTPVPAQSMNFEIAIRNVSFSSQLMNSSDYPHMLRFSFIQEYYNPSAEVEQITKYSDSTPDARMSYDLENSSESVYFLYAVMDIVYDPPYSPGVTTRSSSLTGYSNGSVPLPYGTYTISPKQVNTDNSDLTGAVYHSYQLISNDSGVHHFPPELPDYWGDIQTPPSSDDTTLSTLANILSLSSFLLLTQLLR